MNEEPKAKQVNPIEGARPAPRTLCWSLSLVSLGAAVISMILRYVVVTDLVMVTVAFSMLCALASAIALPLELISLLFRSREQWPSLPRMSYSIPVWVLAVFILVLSCIPIMYEPSRRSNVARVKGDQRTMAIALETYYLDSLDNGGGAYPAWSLERSQSANGPSLRDKKNVLQKIPSFRLAHGSKLATLTTPISYISSYFTDPFTPVKGATFAYWTPDNEITTQGLGYIVWSPGPDGDYDITIDNVARVYTPHLMVPNPAMLEVTYDPSNGTSSNGDVYRYKQ